MKRANHLMPQIVDKESLYLAFWKARRGKNGVKYVETYRNNLEQNLNQLACDLKSGNISVGNYTYFKIYDPKERLICAARFEERVLHNALMNVCHPFFEKYQINESYASRKNKGTYAALDKALHYQKKYRWFLKLDVRKYFDSIHHQVMQNLLKQRFKEPLLLNIFGKIIDIYSSAPSRGLPIGNLTSQYFANHYLAVADHFIKEKLKAKAYVRYMDDMVIWDNDKTQLNQIGKQFSAFIAKHLLLNLKPFCLNKTHLGLPFLGYVVYQDKIHLNQSSRRRFRKKLNSSKKLFETNIWSENEYQAHLLPLLAFTQKAESKKFRQLCLTP